MNRLSRQIIVSALAIMAFLTVMGIAGSYDWADQVVYTTFYIYSLIYLPTY